MVVHIITNEIQAELIEKQIEILAEFKERSDWFLVLLDEFKKDKKRLQEIIEEKDAIIYSMNADIRHLSMKICKSDKESYQFSCAGTQTQAFKEK